MITIQTRENSKGKWWCNTTYACEDIFVEAETPTEAQTLMASTLRMRGFAGEINWSKLRFYDKKINILKQKSHIPYAVSRIDNNPIA